MRPIVATVTARGGSKGVPGKNMRRVGGLTLVARSVIAATHLPDIDEVVVTTDQAEIAEEARRYGAGVVWRPAALATDRARSIEAVVHCLDVLDFRQGTHVLLQPTSPMRRSQDIDGALRLYESRAFRSVLSACEVEHHPWKTFALEDEVLIPSRQLEHLETPRQSLPEYFRANGAVYINDIGDLHNLRRFLIPSIGIYRMSRTASLDIDSEIDLTLAAQILSEDHLVS